jgi:nucleoid DNA-binding protein
MSLGLVKEKEVAKLSADETTLNSKEAKMILYQLLKVIVHLLLEGHTVQSGELGSFRLTSLLTPYHRRRETAGTVRQQLSIKVKDFIHLKI